MRWAITLTDGETEIYERTQLGDLWPRVSEDKYGVLIQTDNETVRRIPWNRVASVNEIGDETLWGDMQRGTIGGRRMKEPQKPLGELHT